MSPEPDSASTSHHGQAARACNYLEPIGLHKTLDRNGRRRRAATLASGRSVSSCLPYVTATTRIDSSPAVALRIPQVPGTVAAPAPCPRFSSLLPLSSSSRCELLSSCLHPPLRHHPTPLPSFSPPTLPTAKKGTTSRTMTRMPLTRPSSTPTPTHPPVSPRIPKAKGRRRSLRPSSRRDAHGSSGSRAPSFALFVSTSTVSARTQRRSMRRRSPIGHGRYSRGPSLTTSPTCKR